MLEFKNGYITSDRECWTLTMRYLIDKDKLSEKQLAKVKNDYSEVSTYYGNLEQAVSAYCDKSLKDIDQEATTLLEALQGLNNEIKKMDLSKFKRYQND